MQTCLKQLVHILTIRLQSVNMSKEVVYLFLEMFY
jgi:hypothetical protein